MHRIEHSAECSLVTRAINEDAPKLLCNVTDTRHLSHISIWGKAYVSTKSPNHRKRVYPTHMRWHKFWSVTWVLDFAEFVIWAQIVAIVYLRGRQWSFVDDNSHDSYEKTTFQTCHSLHQPFSCSSQVHSVSHSSSQSKQAITTQELESKRCLLTYHTSVAHARMEIIDMMIRGSATVIAPNKSLM